MQESVRFVQYIVYGNHNCINNSRLGKYFNCSIPEDLTKNQEKSGCSSSETLSEESSSDEETHKKKRKVTFSSPPDSTEMSEYEKERNQRVADRQAEEFELFGFAVR